MGGLLKGSARAALLRMATPRLIACCGPSMKDSTLTTGIDERRGVLTAALLAGTTVYQAGIPNRGQAKGLGFRVWISGGSEAPASVCRSCRAGRMWALAGSVPNKTRIDVGESKRETPQSLKHA